MVCFKVGENAFFELVVEANDLNKLQNYWDLWLIYRKGHNIILSSSTNKDVDLNVGEIVRSWF